MQAIPRRNVRIIHHNNDNSANQPNHELSYSSSSVPSRKGQRNISVMPQRESSSVIRGTKGLNESNLFIGNQEDSPIKLHPSRRHE